MTGNRLANESSPYLRQHASNPVDWYPWGDEAFAEAKRRDVPILLSVGYSSCHWCHVMAHESFEHGPTATIMNKLFVNVKVDREERPDVDGIYMDAVQAFTGRGGWPMTVFLAPNGRPFFGGTYFPNSPRHGMTSFTHLMENIYDVWTYRREDLMAQADQVTDAIRSRSRVASGDRLPGLDTVRQACETLLDQHDTQWGGFGRAPKFPQTMAHEALLRWYTRTGDDALLDVVTTSLDAMASGGVYDQLTGGFARYSTDEHWIIPHFEKMLYDNALLARLYLHAWQVTGLARFRQVLDETIGYVLDDMTHPLGGFYSAEDADSEGGEGKFAVWSLAEVREVLAAADLSEHADEVMAWYGMTEHGNFEGLNNPIRAERGDLARPPHIEAARVALLARRRTRISPGLDDKVLTEWNGLMLATLAEAAAATGNVTWLAAAIRNGEFLVEHLLRDGRWMRSWQADSGARHLGYASDYAALVDAFVRLGEATGQARWTRAAVETADAMIRLFADSEAGGLFSTGTDAEELLTRPKDLLDSATPSANTMAAVALLRLGALVGREDYTAFAEQILSLVGTVAVEHPTALGNALAGIDLAHGPITEVVVVGNRDDLVQAVQRCFRPNTVLAWGERFASPLWEGRTEEAAYVCQNYACSLPSREAASLEAELRGCLR